LDDKRLLKGMSMSFFKNFIGKRVKKREGLKFTWKGALRELKSRYSSVELQHKALEWWISPKAGDFQKKGY